VPKRAFDILVTLLSAPLVIPVVALTAIALAIDLRGNPFFLQRRIGLHGRPFTMFKLRTMHYAAPGQQPTYQVDDWSTFIFSPPGYQDPRTTRLGAFARSKSLDELPNLLNVLLGQMSLVGPRPEIPEIVAQYPTRFDSRHNVRPGITGLAQVHGRSDLTYEESASYDLEYVQAHTLMGDLRILLQTARLALTGKGAR
jgi:lipopolysaccharide/colanic/teichoic acid biosynthesis glycosyltransferase